MLQFPHDPPYPPGDQLRSEALFLDVSMKRKTYTSNLLQKSLPYPFVIFSIIYPIVILFGLHQTLSEALFLDVSMEWNDPQTRVLTKD